MSLPELHYGDLSKDKYVNKRLEKYGKFLEPYLVEGKTKILEIGCYTADLINFLPVKVDYYGVDFDDKALEIAKKRGVNTIKCQLDISEFPITDKFDVVICTEVLEHLVDPVKMVENIKGLMKDDGVVLISLPNENSIYHRIMSLSGKGIDMCAFELYKHLHMPTVSQSRDFLSTHFEIVEECYYINPSAKGSRTEWLGTVVSFVPDFVWNGLADKLPGLFARGTVFLLKKR